MKLIECVICGEKFKPGNQNVTKCNKCKEKEKIQWNLDHTANCIVCRDEFVVKRRRLVCYNKKHYLYCPECSKYKLITKASDLNGSEIEFIKEEKGSYYFKYKNVDYYHSVCNDCRKSDNIIKLRNKLIKERLEKACLKKYGNKRFSASETGKEKLKEIMLSKYGVGNPMQIEEIRNKTSKIISSKEVQDKTKQTNQKKYGVKHVMHDKNIKEKKLKTDRENHGGILAVYTDESKNKLREYIKENKEEWLSKRKATTLERYGCESYNQTKEWKDLMRTKLLNGEYTPANGYMFSRHSKVIINDKRYEFKSSWEFIYALYLYLNNIDFEYESLRLPYKDIDDKDRVYVIDFLVNNEVHEVKGDFEDFDVLQKTKGRAVVDNGYRFKIIKRDYIKEYLNNIKEFGIDLVSILEEIMNSDKDNVPTFNFVNLKRIDC